MHILKTLILLLLLTPARLAYADAILVFAASSLQTTLSEIVEIWHNETEIDVQISYGGSGLLANQILQGAPADIFISAAPEWMDVLDDENRLHPDTRINLLSNQMVLIAHDLQAEPIQAETLDFDTLLTGKRLAIASPEAVPAGRYAKEVLQHYNAWDFANANSIQTDNVRSALALVAHGEADYGLVYLSDARAETGVRNLTIFPDNTHSKILYPAVIIGQNPKPEIMNFYNFLTRDPSARKAFTDHGFIYVGGDE